MIAALTGITTVGDFRPADMAVGGQGAPARPFARLPAVSRFPSLPCGVNIGGIANFTLFRRARPQDLFAFDTGPGNMVIDALVRHFTRESNT